MLGDSKHTNTLSDRWYLWFRGTPKTFCLISKVDVASIGKRWSLAMWDQCCLQISGHWECCHTIIGILCFIAHHRSLFSKPKACNLVVNPVYSNRVNPSEWPIIIASPSQRCADRALNMHSGSSSRRPWQSQKVAKLFLLVGKWWSMMMHVTEATNDRRPAKKQNDGREFLAKRSDPTAFSSSNCLIRAGSASAFAINLSWCPVPFISVPTTASPVDCCWLHSWFWLEKKQDLGKANRSKSRRNLWII